ncbi:phosphatase [Aceticella autotrophica]|uniref:Phosphatase n=1 Tax=Aceticella autotrophica TaxID=2755338 RepID=A0A975AX66_9THEO|nr:phosphatase [Aceticella autotrophica]QSZ28129.1 phosphatase [Aceticella autotrophica]
MKLVLDTHTHTIASGHAYSTIIENAREASKKGLKLICMTDHGPCMFGAPHLYYFGNLKVVPSIIEGVEIIKGVEANIIDTNGKLDIPDRILDDLDIVIASLHEACFEYRDIGSNTKALINAIKNPYVDIIGHSGNPLFPIDIDEVLLAAKEYDTHIEINNSSFIVSRVGSCENCLKIAQKAAKIGVRISVGSDAHIAFDIGRFDKALEIIEKVRINEDMVLNTSVDKFKKYLKGKGKLKG